MNLQEFNELVDQAAELSGSQRKLADVLEMSNASLIQMKQGKRPANWRVRGGLRVVLGEEPARAFMTAMAEELELSEKADEKKAADGFKAILAAFPALNEESPNDQIVGADSWRKRRDSNPR